jgi:Trypsin-co-occurring domain 2
MAKVPKFELKQMLEQLSQQLVEVDKAARARGDAILQLDECEVQLAITMDGGGSAGIKFWVIELGVNAKTENANTITVKFKPIDGKAIQAGQKSTQSPAPAVKRQTPRKA